MADEDRKNENKSDGKSSAGGSLIVHDRMYSFCKWIYPAVANYPRGQRYILGETTTKLATEILLGIARANAEKSKTATIAELLLQVRQLKILLRLAMELKYMSFNGWHCVSIHGARR